MKKEYLKYIIAYLFFIFRTEATKVDLDISFYGPERCGLNGIQTLRFENMDEDLQQSRIRLDGSMYPVPSSALKFDPYSNFILRCPGHMDRPVSEIENKKIKERISALAITLETTRSFQQTISTLLFYDLVPPEVNFNNVSLTITSHDGKCFEKNASYTRTGKLGGQGILSFCSGGFATVQLFDVVAHETGHSLLDALNPLYYTTFTDSRLSKEYSLNHPYRAVHESFGDLASIYTSCNIAISQGKDNQVGSYLNEKDFCVASGWDGPGTCLRASNNYSTARRCEAHNNSILLTKLMIEAMRGTYKEIINYSSFNPSPLLREPRFTLQYFQRLLVSASSKFPSFRSLEGFSRILQETQSEMSRTGVASVDDFTKTSLFVENEIQELFYETAEDNLNKLLEGKLGENMNHCVSDTF